MSTSPLLRDSLLERRAREIYEREAPEAATPFHELAGFARALYVDAAKRSIERELAGAGEENAET